MNPKSKLKSSKLLLTLAISAIDLILLGLSTKYPQYDSMIKFVIGALSAKTGIYVLGESAIDSSGAKPNTITSNVGSVTTEVKEPNPPV